MRASPATAERAFEELRNDEVLGRFARKVEKGAIKPITVLDFLGEQRIIALGMLIGGYQQQNPLPRTPEQLRWEQVSVALALREAVPFLWTHEMRFVALGYDVPHHTIGATAFPHELMWWTFETAIGFEGTDHYVDGVLIARLSRLQEYFPSDSWALVKDGRDGWAMFEVGSLDGRGASGFVRWVATVPDGTESTDLGSFVAWFGMSAFLNSHFVDVSKKRPSDTDKRWRGRRVGDPSALNVVTLRSSVREAVRAESGEGPRWKERWLVRGHLRAQWYPSTRSHRIIWIAPYLKGPEEAPVKVPVYRVAR